jgi:hypothetical protein
LVAICATFSPTHIQKRTTPKVVLGGGMADVKPSPTNAAVKQYQNKYPIIECSLMIPKKSRWILQSMVQSPESWRAENNQRLKVVAD